MKSTSLLNDPTIRANVEAASFAYHIGPDHPDGHLFTGGRHDPCQWCGRTRWEVRQSDSPRCDKHPRLRNPPDIAGIIKAEEERFARMMERLPQALKGLELTGENLAILHHTHGFSPEDVETYLDQDLSDLLDEYEHHMNIHRSKS